MVILPKMNSELVANEICEFIRETIKNQNKSGAVVGLSGGIDSAVVTLLALRAFKDTDYEIKAYILPTDNNNNEETLRASKLTRKYKIGGDLFYLDYLTKISERPFNNKLNQFDKGNMISRIRANLLSTYAAIENKVLIGTGNKDEDFGIGYYTLFGDGAVHCNPIGELSKRLVYQMGEYLNVPDEIMKAKPTAGLENGQTDLGDLGYDYDMIEFIIEAMSQKIDPKLIVDEIRVKKFKYDGNKFETLEDVLLDILDRHKGSLMKMRIIHPPTPTISLDYK